MKSANYLLASCLFMSVMNGFFSTPASADIKPGAVVRSVELAQNSDGSGDACVIDATEDQTVGFTNDNFDCENDQMNYFKLDNVRSAVRIRLESRECNDEGGWVFELKTTIDPITTGWIAIASLQGHPADYIVTRGVWITVPYSGGENINGKLSCVRINVSD